MKRVSLFNSSVCIGTLFNWFKITRCRKCSEVVFEELQLYRLCIHVRTLNMTLTSLPPHICTLECIRRQDCLFTNYNTDKGYCLLIDDKCMQWEVDNDFEPRYFGVPRQKCVSWVSVSVFNPNLAVSYAGGTFARRWKDALDTVPGKDVPTHSKIDVTMSDGAHAFPRGIEVLQIHPECPVAGDHTSICFHLHRQGQSTRSSITHIDIFRHLIYSTAHSTLNARGSTCNLRFKCWNIRETCPYHSKPPKSSLISENGLAPNRRYAFIWTNAYPVHWSYMLRSASTN